MVCVAGPSGAVPGAVPLRSVSPLPDEEELCTERSWAQGCDGGETMYSDRAGEFDRPHGCPVIIPIRGTRLRGLVLTCTTALDAIGVGTRGDTSAGTIACIAMVSAMEEWGSILLNF